MSLHRYQPSPEQTSSVQLWSLPCAVNSVEMTAKFRGIADFLASDQEGTN
jgi:hypothetical protein